MKHWIIPVLALTASLLSAQTKPAAPPPAPVDSVDGYSIQYDIVRRVDGQNVKIVVVTAGDGPGDGPEAAPPSTINQEQTAFISTAGGVLGEPEMPLPPGMPDDVERVIFRPVKETTGMDFAKGETQRIISAETDPEKKVYYSSEPFSTPKDWKVSKKTKEFAGYTCQKATCTVGDLEYTVWFTTQIEGRFSPMTNLFPPDKGVVLALESDDVEYKAAKVDLKARGPKPAVAPADAVKLTPDELKAKRRALIEKAMEAQGGPNIRIRRN